MRLLLLLTFVTASSAASAADLKQLAALSESQIDLGRVSLILAKDLYPDLDVDAYFERLDILVARARAHARGSSDPDLRIRSLNTYLFKIERFGYDHSDSANNKLENRFLNGILDTRKGTCMTLPLLYMAIAQRLGYPIYPVAAPEHLFLRYVHANGSYQNIEATNGGEASDDRYIRDFRVSDKALKSGGYMRTMTY